MYRGGPLGGAGVLNAVHLDSRESTTTFEKMDLDELHTVQEELKKKM